MKKKEDETHVTVINVQLSMILFPYAAQHCLD